MRRVRHRSQGTSSQPHRARLRAPIARSFVPRARSLAPHAGFLSRLNYFLTRAPHRPSPPVQPESKGRGIRHRQVSPHGPQEDPHRRQGPLRCQGRQDARGGSQAPPERPGWFVRHRKGMDDYEEGHRQHQDRRRQHRRHPRRRRAHAQHHRDVRRMEVRTPGKTPPSRNTAVRPSDPSSKLAGAARPRSATPSP